MEAFWDKIRLLLFCIMYIVLFPVLIAVLGLVIANSLIQFLAIIITFLILCLVKGIYVSIYKSNSVFLKVRGCLSLFSIIAFIALYFISVYNTAGETIYVFNQITAVNVVFLVIFVILLIDRLWIWFDYLFDRNIKIGLIRKYKWETENCIIELTKEKGINNLYCYNKGVSSDKNIFQMCVIREIDNNTKNYYFTKMLFDNYAGADWFLYSDFIDFANKNGMFLKTYNLSKPLDDSKKSLNILIKENGINIEPKKLNINEASLQEIISLPFINIVTAKKIINHREEDNFKSFWEFSEFLKLTENQGMILSKLVFVKSVKEKKILDDINKEDYKRDLDL